MSRTRGSMEKLHNMLGISMAKKTDFREEPRTKLDNDTMCDLIESRLGTMMARHAELQTKLDEIEERRDPESRQKRLARYIPIQYTVNGVPVSAEAVARLKEAIQALAAEIREMKEEQKIMKEQVQQMRDYVVRAK